MVVQLDDPVGSRVTASRAVIPGVLALAARKRDTAYPTIEGPDWVADIEVFRTKVSA